MEESRLTIRCRFGPTYVRDLKRAGLGQKTEDELGEAWEEIVSAFKANSSHPEESKAGTAIPKNAREIYKKRIADPDRNRGKSGGYRLIYWWRETEREIVGLYFYLKSEKEDVTQKEIEAARKAFISRNDPA